MRWKITDKKRLRKYYRLTDKGIEEQEKEKEQWFLVSGIFSRFLEAAPASGRHWGPDEDSLPDSFCSSRCCSMDWLSSLPWALF
jgi:hypothetical protein